MKVYNYLLFDWDGCLAPTLEVWLDVYRETFIKYGISITDKQITEHIFGDLNAPGKFGVKDNYKFMDEVNVEVNKRLKNISLNPHVKETLSFFKRKSKILGIISTSERRNILPALSLHKISDLFPVVLTQEDITNHKPHPEIIDKSLKQMNGSKETALIIGDTQKDIDAGHNAHIDSVLYYPASHKKFYKLETLKASKPTYVITDFEELTQIVK